MRTTLKIGLGRADGNGNGHAVLPPGAITPVTRYQQPPPPRRGGWGVLRLLVFWGFAAVLMVAGGLGGGYYLWLHREVSKLQPHSAGVKKAAKQLDIAPPPGQPTVALVIGYDHRLGADARLGDVTSRSDTVMLIRADPQTNSLSLLSFPRDLVVDRICPGHVTVQDRINSAYAVCGPQGTLETVKNLTKLKINYLVTVNFHGFKDIVSRVGGVWLDVDRRYYNKNVGTAGTNFADIDLQPGYQRLNGQQALDYVRYRHTDSDIYRTARQQLFLGALKQQIRRTYSFTSVISITKLIDTIVNNVEVAPKTSLGTLKSWALFGHDLPPGHVFRIQIPNLQPYGLGNAELIAAPQSIQAAVQQFESPDVGASKTATNAALGVKPKATAPPATSTTVLPLNGNGVPNSAAALGGILHQRGYQIVVPPNQLPANAPTFDYFRTKVYFAPHRPADKAAARKLANLIGDADIAPLPRRIRGYGAMVTVIVGSTFHGTLAPAPVDSTPVHQPPAVTPSPSSVLQLATEAQRQLPFRVEVPTVLERTSQPDYEEPTRVYRLGKHRSLRFVFRTGQSEYWGIEETTWNDAPVLSGPSLVRRLSGRAYRLYYSGSHLHMVVLAQHGATYWVVNTLLDSLSNETMLAIAKGLRTYGH